MCHPAILILAGLSLLLAADLRADCPELVGRAPGRVPAIATSGGFIYFGSGSTLLVGEISDPGAPRVVGEVALPNLVSDIAISGHHVFVASFGAGLRVIDVSTPTAPVEVGSWDTEGPARAVAVSGDYAYVTTRTFEPGLWVIDVSTPSAPIGVGFVDTPWWPDAVAVSGGYAYVVVYSGQLRVFDVGTPSAPFEVGSVDTPGPARDVAIEGAYAYVAASGGGLLVVDVSTPSAPDWEALLDTTGEALGVEVDGGYGYVVGPGLSVIDVATPAAPLEVGFVDTPGMAEHVAVVASGYAYVAAQGGGVRVIDVRTPAAPVEVTFRGGTGSDIAVSGGYAYLVGGHGLQVIDVSVPAAPVDVGSDGWGGAVGSVAVAGDYAYVTQDSGEMVPGASFRVVDVSTPSAPVVVAYLQMVDDLLSADVAVAGDYAYLAGGVLSVIDVSWPSEPLEVGFLDTTGHASAVATSGDYVYAAGNGLSVIDVSTPWAPFEVGSVETPGRFTDVAVAGDYAYSTGYYGLHVIDVSTPWAPFEVGFFQTPEEAIDVAIGGGYAYVTTDFPFGLRVIDVSTPSAPFEIGFYATFWGSYPDDSTSVAVSDGYVYLAAGAEGLYVFRECVGPALDASASFIPAAALATGAEGAFFQTDLEINNKGPNEAQVYFNWLPRGEDNSISRSSDLYTLSPGQSLRYENALAEIFGLGPDSLGALKMVASTDSVIGMSRNHNSPEGKAAGTFGQGLPAIRATEMIQGTEPQRIIFLSEDPDSRANVGCVNGTGQNLTISIGVFDNEGTWLYTRPMDLGPWSNNQINRIFRDYQPVNGYVDVWADSDDALYYCYGSMLDNSTSDPTTILPQVPSDDITFIPAAALAAGLEGSFFETDVDLNNFGSTDITYRLVWLPRGADNGEPVRSDLFSLAPGAGVRYANVLDEVFGLEPDQVGALAVEASGTELLAMSRTYNLPSAKVAGTFGQELPGIPADRMIPTGVKKRIIFLSENDDVRANVGCQNGSAETVRVFIELFNSAGESLEVKTMDLAPYSNNQITRVFRNHAPISAGYVDIWTATPGATISCYGSVLDNLTSDPTTVLPQ